MTTSKTPGEPLSTTPQSPLPKERSLDTEQSAPSDTTIGNPPQEDLASLNRILALTDLVIGLEAELAETRYQRDLAERELERAGVHEASAYEPGEDAQTLVENARLIAEIELRQGLARQLAAERERADALEHQLVQARSSLTWRAEQTARTAARATRNLWR